MCVRRLTLCLLLASDFKPTSLDSESIHLYVTRKVRGHMSHR